MSHKQGNMFAEVIQFEEAKNKQNKQQKFFETVRILNPDIASAFEQLSENLTHQLIEQQKQNEKKDKQIDRFLNTTERLVDKIDNFSINNKEPDVCVAEGIDPDIVMVNSALPAEVVYTLTTTQLGKAIGKNKLHPSQLGSILKNLGIKGNSNFHHDFATSEKQICPKYKPSTIKELYKRLNNPLDYGIEPEYIEKIIHKFKPIDKVIQK